MYFEEFDWRYISNISIKPYLMSIFVFLRDDSLNDWLNFKDLIRMKGVNLKRSYKTLKVLQN